MKIILSLIVTLSFFACTPYSGGNGPGDVYSEPTATSSGGAGKIFEISHIEVSSARPMKYASVQRDCNFYIEFVSTQPQFYNQPMAQGYIHFEPQVTWTTWQGSKVQYGPARSVYFELVSDGRNNFYMTAEDVVIEVIPGELELDFKRLVDVEITIEDINVMLDGYTYKGESIKSKNGRHTFSYAL